VTAEPQTTYFGLWSKQKIDQATALLDTLGVRYEVLPQPDIEQERLENWCAWDPASDDPHTGYHLDIWSEDMPKAGYKIIETFPERKFSV
jgi:hypothetical protein